MIQVSTFRLLQKLKEITKWFHSQKQRRAFKEQNRLYKKHGLQFDVYGNPIYLENMSEY